MILSQYWHEKFSTFLWQADMWLCSSSWFLKDFWQSFNGHLYEKFVTALYASSPMSSDTLLVEAIKAGHGKVEFSSIEVRGIGNNNGVDWINCIVLS